MIGLSEIIGKVPIDKIPHEHLKNIDELLRKINLVRQHWGKPMYVTSGYRSKEDHIRVYKELNERRRKERKSPVMIPMRSRHLIGKACDIADPDGSLMKWCQENEDLLREIGLWLEAPDQIKRVHFQIEPFGSYVAGGTIFFMA